MGRRTISLWTCGLLTMASSQTAHAEQAGAPSQPGDITAPATQPEAAREPAALEDIVVTARKTAERSQTVPIAITTVTSQRLIDLNVRDVLDVQKVAPGLQIQSQGTGGRAKIAIRGQSEADSRLTTDGSVGVYIDGVPFVRSYGLRSSLADIAQIEVLKGPQGTLFGKNTTGGALNVTTQHPTYVPGGYVDLLYGEYDSAQALAVLNLPLVNDKLALRAVGQVVTRKGFGRDGNGRDIQDDDVVNGRLLLRVDPTQSVDILLSADFVRQRNAGSSVIITQDAMLANANRASGTLGAIAAQLGLDPNSAVARVAAYNVWQQYLSSNRRGSFYDTAGTSGYRDDLNHDGISATVAVDLGFAQAKSITAYRKLTRSSPQDLDGTPFDLLVVDLATRQKNLSQEVQLAALDGRGLDWQLGAFYNRETGNELSINNTNSFVNGSRAAVTDGDVENQSIAGYGQATLHLADRLRVTGGLRYTADRRTIVSHNRVDPQLATLPAVPASAARCNLLTPALGGPAYPNCNYRTSTDFSALTWLASVDWKPTPDTLLYISNSRGYRAGGYTLGAAGTLQVSQAQLNASFTPFAPEKVTNYEIGLKSELLDRRLRFNAAVYYQDYTDIQVQIRDVIDNYVVTLIRNAASARLYGGEVEITAVPAPGLTLTAAGSYVNARYRTFIARDTAGNPTDRSAERFPVPRFTFNLGAAYEIPLANGHVRVTANYAWQDDTVFRPETPTLAGVTQTAYGLLDARVTWHIASQGLDLAAFGRNLTNKKYIISATNLESQGYNVAFPGDPRILGVEMRKTF